jgi:hypothetical protein
MGEAELEGAALRWLWVSARDRRGRATAAAN